MYRDNGSSWDVANHVLPSAQVNYTSGDFSFNQASFTEISSSLRLTLAASTR